MIRGRKVMLHRDLAELYGVETKQLKRQVKRNIERFPDDFMFELNVTEFQKWRGQFGTSNEGDRMGLRYGGHTSCFWVHQRAYYTARTKEEDANRIYTKC